MVLNIMKIEYFFIVLELHKVEYLVFLFFFSYFLYLTDFLTRFKAGSATEFPENPS